MWVTRDKNGALKVFANKPKRYQLFWSDSDDYPDGAIMLNPGLFPELTYNDEPIEVKLIPVSTNEEDLEKLAREYYKSNERGYEFENYHIGYDDIIDAYKEGYRKAKEN